MSKEKLDWFNLDNYESSKNFSAKEWAVEIEERLLMEFFLSEDKKNSITSEGINNYKYGLDRYEHIKNFGLFNTGLSDENVIEFDRKIDDRNRYVTDLTTEDAFGFLYYSDRKNEYIDDISKWNACAIGSGDAKKWFEIMKDKYGKAMSDELVENYDRDDKLRNEKNVFSNDLGCRFLNVDLNTSDEILIEEFKKWLQIQRVDYDFKFPESNFKRTQFVDWYKNQLLAYWDIVTLSKFDGIAITNEAIGRLLFPDEFNVAISERIRKVVRPKSKRLMNIDVAEMLSSQAHVE